MTWKRNTGAVGAVALSFLLVAGRVQAAQSAGMTYRVNASQVVAAAAARGLSVLPDQVEFLSAVKSSQPEPALEIEHLQAANGKAMLARIRCHAAGECLPFLVVLHFSPSQNVQAMLVNQGAAEVQPRRTAKPQRAAWTIKSGQTAMFVFEGKSLRATIPVVCLQNGREGESIRVSSLDRKQILVGEIVGPGLLHRAL